MVSRESISSCSIIYSSNLSTISLEDTNLTIIESKNIEFIDDDVKDSWKVCVEINGVKYLRYAFIRNLNEGLKESIEKEKLEKYSIKQSNNITEERVLILHGEYELRNLYILKLATIITYKDIKYKDFIKLITNNSNSIIGDCSYKLDISYEIYHNKDVSYNLFDLQYKVLDKDCKRSLYFSVSKENYSFKIDEIPLSLDKVFSKIIFCHIKIEYTKKEKETGPIDVYNFLTKYLKLKKKDEPIKIKNMIEFYKGYLKGLKTNIKY